jgi:hypothetical protein
MNLTDKEKLLLDTLSKNGKGLFMYEIEIETKLKYAEIMRIAQDLIAKGYWIKGRRLHSHRNEMLTLVGSIHPRGEAI